jgi:sugar O-acyltransferase (sialic acid O-acetyltransferase NeuD family)
LKKIIIYTAGSGSQEILLNIRQINEINPEWEILGFVDEDLSLSDSEIQGLPVFPPNHKEISRDVYGICGVLDPLLRKRITEELIEGRGMKLASIISCNSRIPTDFEYGPGTLIMPDVTISYGVKLGKGVLVFWGAALGHNLVVGNYSSILSFATITGNCKIGNSTIIGASSTLNVGVQIGNNSLVGVGTTIFKNVKDNLSVIDLPRQITTKR